MRLTLRTMLAYLDDILEPDDEAQLSAKIRESDFASGLVHRIRNTVAKARLSSPQVLGRGLAADANSVAEYLDNTLSADRVPDFEKICLESDLHLSEVAACHQILTLVLGEPASFPAPLRQRIYGLNLSKEKGGAALGDADSPSHALHHRLDEAAHANRPTSRRDAAAPVATKPGTDRNAEGTIIPDYLKASAGRRTRLWIPLTILAMAVFAGVYLTLLRPQALGPFAQPPAADPSAEAGVAVEEGGAHTLPPTDMNVSPETAAAESLPALPPAAFEAEVASVPPPLPSDLPPDLPPELPMVAPNEDASNPGAMLPETDPNPSPAASVGEGEASPIFPEALPPDPSLVASRTDGIARPLPGMEAAAVTPSSEPLAPAVIAGPQLLSDEEVLMTWDEANSKWARVAPRVAIPAGLRLLVPASFRPRVLIGQNIDLQLLSGAEVVVGDGVANHLRLNAGRMVIGNVGTTVEEIRVETPEGMLAPRLVAPGTVLALESRRVYPLGSDPRRTAPGFEVRMWVTAGEVEVAAAGAAIRYSEGTVAAVHAQVPWTQAKENAPEWSYSLGMRDIDRRARDLILAGMDPTADFMDSVEVFTRGKRSADAQSLAGRILASLGRLDPLVDSLDDPRQHFSWPEHVQLLQALVRRDVATATAVEAALRTRYRAEADRLFPLLWGYDLEALQRGDAERLVGYLDDPSLPMRILAFENLRQITGKPGTYRPTLGPSRRRDAIQGWRKRLKNGEIGGLPPSPPKNPPGSP